MDIGELQNPETSLHNETWVPTPTVDFSDEAEPLNIYFKLSYIGKIIEKKL